MGCLAAGAAGGCAADATAPDDPAPAARASAIAVHADVVISQVYGGGGNASAQFRNDFVELFNRGAAPALLDGLSIQYSSATGTGAFSANRAALAGSLAPGQYYLVQLAAGTAASAPLPAPDLVAPTNIGMAAGAGKVALVSGAAGLACNGGSLPCADAQLAAIIDLVGYGNANFFEGHGAAPALANTTAALRNGGGCSDTNNNDLDFTAAAPQPRNRAAPAAPCGPPVAPSVAATSPADGATGVDPAARISVTFNEPVAVGGGGFAIACSASGAVAAAPSGGPVTFTLAPSAPFAFSESCTVTVAGAAVTDLDAGGAMAADVTFAFTVAAPLVPIAIHDIQGAAHLSPLRGAKVETHGIVTVARSNGFYLQDPMPDADDATSEAIFVFTGGAPSAAAGDAVDVTGIVSEFRPGCSPSCAASDSDFANLTSTELTAPSVSVLSTGNPLPPPVVIGRGPGARTPPTAIIDDDSVGGDVEAPGGTFDPASDGIDFYESLEAMRVQINDAVAVEPTQTTSGGALEVAVLADGGADAGVRSAHGGIVLSPGDFNPERIIVTAPALPPANVADSFPGAIVGVIDYGFGNFKLVATEPLPAPLSGGVGPESFRLPPPAPAELTVGSMNMENMDPGDPPEKFQRLGQIIVDNLQAPDILALAEVQDSNGATNNGVVEASLTFSTLIAAITAAGGPTYDFRAIDPVNDQDGGEPGGNIRVAWLFRGDRGLAFVDRPGGDATTADSVVSAGGAPQLAFSPGRIDPTNAAFAGSRKPLAAELTFAGARVFAVANHFNSKGGDDPLFGRFQPPTLSSEPQRLQQAAIVGDFVSRILAIDPGARVLAAGDLNDYEFSSALRTLVDASGLVDLVPTLPPERRYTFNFEGNSQVLDHILVSPALRADLVGYDIVHVNSEFLVQASDHDPEVARFRIDLAPPLLHLPAAIAAEATGPGGAAVGFAVSADDAVDGGVPVTCAPASGSVFPLGATAVGCTAIDAHGNAARGTFTVTVRDTTAPMFSRVPGTLRAYAASRAGAVVRYVLPIATDAVSGAVAVICAPPSGSTFAPGTSAIGCRAADAAGNVASASFTVDVTCAAPRTRATASAPRSSYR